MGKFGSIACQIENQVDPVLVKSIFALAPLFILCSCGGINPPAEFASPQEAAAAQASAAKATGLQASQLAGLSPKQIAVIEKLPVEQLAQLKGLKGPQLANKLGEVAASQLTGIGTPTIGTPTVPELKKPTLPKFQKPALPGFSKPTLPGLEGLPAFSDFKGGRISKPQALQLAQMTGLEAPQFKKLSIPELTKLRDLKAPQLAELKGLKGSAFNKKLNALEAPKTPWWKSPFVNRPVYADIKKGMSAEEVTQALGRPSYKYHIAGEETWVFENANFIMKKIKSTAINMVPALGPASTFVGGLRQGPAKSGKAAVTFDASGKVIAAKQG